MPTNEELMALIELARSGTKEERQKAIERLLGHLRKPALATIYKTLGKCRIGREHAEDALQMACVNFIAKGLKQYDGTASPTTYFCRIALRCTIDLVRRLSRDVSSVSIEDAEAFSEQAPLPHKGRERTRPEQRPKPSSTDRVVMMLLDEIKSDPASRKRVALALCACLEELPPTYLEAINLYCLEEIGDHATCASRVGIGLDAFMKRLSRARLQLADCLASKVGDRTDLADHAAGAGSRPAQRSKVKLS